MGLCIAFTLLIVFICIVSITKSLVKCSSTYRCSFVRNIMILESLLVFICYDMLQCYIFYRVEGGFIM